MEEKMNNTFLECSMFKKLLIASAILAVTSGVALAAPYVGGSVGVDVNTNNNNNFRGVPFSVFGGYGTTVSQNIYLAGEVFGTVGTASLNDNGLKSTYGYGVSVIPGLMLSDRVMAFARAGVVRTHFSPTGVRNTNDTGGQLGLGLQTGLTQNLDLRGEYDYTSYGKFSGLSKVTSDQFSLGLVYRFE